MNMTHTDDLGAAESVCECTEAHFVMNADRQTDRQTDVLIHELMSDVIPAAHTAWVGC